MEPRLENILLEVSKSSLIDDGELMQAYRLVLSCLNQGLSIQRAGIWFINAEKTEISCQLLIDTFHDTEIEELTISANDFPAYFNALIHERTIKANDAHIHPATSEFSKEYLTPLNISSMLDVPIRHKGEMIGIICCEHIGKTRNWSDDEADFVSYLANVIGRAINANAFKKSEIQLQAMNEQLEIRVQKQTKQLLESEKMAALGNLVAGVAHEVNTPLGISITSSSALEEAVKSLEKAMLEGRLSKQVFQSFLTDSAEMMQLLNNNLHRAAELVKNFKQTAVDHSDQSIHIFNLDESIQYLLMSLKPELKKKPVNVTIDCPKELAIYSYPSSWLQIISNLVLNSCRHAFADTDNAQINIKIQADNQQITLTYSDNGSGIAEEHLDKVFLPFFTTARGNGGTGLGMSIIYNLITEQLRGKIELNEQKSDGFEVTITCPLFDIHANI